VQSNCLLYLQQKKVTKHLHHNLRSNFVRYNSWGWNNLGGPKMLLDIGCGSGLSGSVLEENGHFWVGIDISAAMLG
jgi:2-polyprenyl-3-methyl-5-hydroxy-6-metoxy-1,4-benzoquinol methylase